MKPKPITKQKFFKLSIWAIIVAIAIIACKKGFSDRNKSAMINEGFTVASIKFWYTKDYERTIEWSNAWAHNRKFPDWKNGVYFENTDLSTQSSSSHYEFLQFPLLKQKSSFLVPSDNSLNSTQKQQLVAASLSRVVFIRKDNSDVFVREVDFIPDWQYLQRKNFDISKTCYGRKDDDFTGAMIIKDWDENILSMRILKDGKIIKIMKRAIQNRIISNTQAADLYCVPGEACMWYEDCQVIGDSWTSNCGEPYMDPTDCIPVDNCPPSGGNLCDLYGIGCDDHGGGDPAQGQCDQTAFNQAQQDFNNYVIMETSTPVTHDANTSNSSNDPIVGSGTWTVVKAQFGGWEIRAKYEFQYYHHGPFFNPNSGWEDNYDLFYFHGGDGYYVGSNTFITSTYTTSDATTNTVINNNTSNTTGISHVKGTIKHESNLKIRFPYCDPITLSSQNDVDNYLYFHPK